MLRVKRVVDVVVAAAILILLSPLMLLIGLVIPLESRGPALFKQTRIGKHRQPFIILKFRTMQHRDIKTVHQVDEAVITSGYDPRVTRLGRILRSTSLDELPQLINILRGEMSLVGPRPVLPEQLEVVPEAYEARFQTRPGVTGLAQVKGRRSLDWEDQLKYDTEYVAKQSLMYDVRILLMTVVVVLTGAGVYGGEQKNWRAYRKDESKVD